MTNDQSPAPDLIVTAADEARIHQDLVLTARGQRPAAAGRATMQADVLRPFHRGDAFMTETLAVVVARSSAIQNA